MPPPVSPRIPVRSARPAMTAELMAATGLDEERLTVLVHAFYDKVRADPLLGPIFEARIADWGPHLEQMVAFWSSVALMTGRFQYRLRGGNDEPIASRHRGSPVLGLPPDHPTLPSLLRDAGWRLDEGIDFRFPSNTVIPPGGYLVAAKDPTALAAKFPGIAIVGPYTNSLSHRGERIVAVALLGEELLNREGVLARRVHDEAGLAILRETDAHARDRGLAPSGAPPPAVLVGGDRGAKLACLGGLGCRGRRCGRDQLVSHVLSRWVEWTIRGELEGTN